MFLENCSFPSQGKRVTDLLLFFSFKGLEYLEDE
jgi:hypothetical protein